MSEFMWRTGANDHVKHHGYTDIFFKTLDEFAVSHFKSYKANEAQYRLSKKQFNEGKQSFVFDNHFRPQIHFITEAWNIYWFEEMDSKFWPEIKNKYGVESPGQQNNTLDKNTYLQNTTKYNFDDSNNIMFSTRRNKKTDLTEYYNFMYQYKNDCLAASIEYNKDYYSDRDVKPEESVFFKLTIIPFGETSSPNLKN